ncbi:bck1-like resistance to osmotic shock [Physocladia obscura]|uniref:BRO domain-containing protein 1 n=1 Tax=Physocladia obscura TaxID=109957 RepID=A0AAD5XIH1_9FUNG|nr:bck1-like resistance to osmotic shock [Physocladia obscura]
MQSPLLFPPTKTTESVDFGPSFRAYIATAYGDDPEKYIHEITLLNRLRDDTRVYQQPKQGAGKDLSGRDIVYRYFGQLELLDLRFPIDGKNVNVSFSWSVFKLKLHSNTTLIDGKTHLLEKLSHKPQLPTKKRVLFSILQRFAPPSQSRTDATGLKIAFNHLQAAAGLFSYINDNFLHPPSVDISRESVKALSDLMLAQAQEVFCEKCLIESKSGLLVAKLAAQCAVFYASAIEGLNDDALKSQISRAWIEIAKTKQKYFESIAHFHKSIHLENDAKYGLAVSHITKSNDLAKESDSFARNFARNYSSFTVSHSFAQNSSLAIISSALVGGSAAPSGVTPAAAIMDLCKAQFAAATARKNTLVKDNDVIYHEPTPPIVEALAALEKLAAAKRITFAELCPNGAADVPKIVGADVFARLVPLSVHTAASVYSEEKAKLLRGELARVEVADEEFTASLDSMGIVQTLDKVKRILKDVSGNSRDILGSEEALGLTDEARKFCDVVRREEGGRGSGTDELLGVIEGLKGKIKTILDEVCLLLDKEQHECENMRVKYMNVWTQEPSTQLTFQIRQDIRSHRESFEKAQETDKGVLIRLNECRRDIAILSRPIDEVESIFIELIRSGSVPKKPEVAVGSLIDGIPDSNGGLDQLGEQIVIEKLDGMIHQLRKLKTERASTILELKSKVHDDDISTSLLLNKNKESQVFQAELAKFKPFQARLATNISTQSQVLSDVASEFEKLKTSSSTIKVLELRERRRNEIVKDWKISFNQWQEAKVGLNKGVKFYSDLSELALSLKNTSLGFVNRRNEEAANLVKKIETDEAIKGQRALQAEMTRLSIGTNAAATQNQSISYNSPTVASPSSTLPQRSSLPPPPISSQKALGQQSYSQLSSSYQQFLPAQMMPVVQQYRPPISQSPTYGGAPPSATSTYNIGSVSGQQLQFQNQQQQQPTPISSGASDFDTQKTANSQPVYGGAPVSQPVYGGTPVSQPVYGGTPQQGHNQPSQPGPNQAIYGGAPQQITRQAILQPGFGSYTAVPQPLTYSGTPLQPQQQINNQQQQQSQQQAYSQVGSAVQSSTTAYYGGYIAARPATVSLQQNYVQPQPTQSQQIYNQSQQHQQQQTSQFYGQPRPSNYQPAPYSQQTLRLAPGQPSGGQTYGYQQPIYGAGHQGHGFVSGQQQYVQSQPLQQSQQTQQNYLYGSGMPQQGVSQYGTAPSQQQQQQPSQHQHYHTPPNYMG